MEKQENQQVLLKKYISGVPEHNDFRIISCSRPSIGDGEALVQTIYISLDPYMRGLMSGQKSYREPAELGEPIPAGTVGIVVDSRAGEIQIGDLVVGYGGWQLFWAEPARKLRKLDPSLAPLTSALGVLGMPGHTAYSGVIGLANLQPGETLLVSAATGAVGSVVGQIAKLKGARVVGIAGSEEKCRYAVDELGFDACFSRKEKLDENFKHHFPDGIDVNFENVGGDIFWHAFRNMNLYGRIIVCGFVSQYNQEKYLTARDESLALLRGLVVKRVQLHGLLVYDWKHLYQEFYANVTRWINEGAIKYKVDIVDGLDNAVAAFQGLLDGKNFGKLVVRVRDDPTVK